MNVRKIITYTEDIHTEGGRPVAGHGYAELVGYGETEGGR